MKERLVDKLRCPACKGQLALEPFDVQSGESQQNDPHAETFIQEGVLLCSACRVWYPIMGRVPVLLAFPTKLHDWFSRKHWDQLHCFPLYAPPYGSAEPGEESIQETFTEEWDTVREDALSFMYTFEELKTLNREVFLKALKTTSRNLESVLNVGVGLGSETRALQEVTGAEIFAIDINLALLATAGRYDTDPNLHFIIASLFHPPFECSSFDLVYSQGVIHHTHSTYSAFKSLASHVRPGGYIFTWIYGLEDHLVRRGLLGFMARLQRATEVALRPVVSRSPKAIRAVFFFLIGILLHPLYRMRQIHKKQWRLRNTVHGLRDLLSPRYAHRHSWNEVLEWFENNGFTVVAPHSPHAYRKLMGKRLWGIGLLGQKPRHFAFMLLLLFLPGIQRHVPSLDFACLGELSVLVLPMCASASDSDCPGTTARIAALPEGRWGTTKPHQAFIAFQDHQTSNPAVGTIFIADGEHYTIQTGIDAAHAAGGGTVFVSKDTPISDPIRLKDGVLLLCAGAPHYDDPTTYHTGRIVPVAGFATQAVVVADPANVRSSNAFITGIGMENCTIDMSNISTSGRTAIELRSVSNSGPFRNITVVNQDDGQYLHIGRSKNVTASPSEGITFQDFYALSKSEDPRNNSPAVVVEEANEITFLGARTKIMRRTRGSPAEGSVGILVRSNGPTGSNHITLDGLSVAGYATHVSVQRFSGKVAPRWVRVLGCTFEVFNRGIELAGDEQGSVQYAFVGNGNRFITPVGLSPANVYVDYGADSTLILDEYATAGARAAQLTRRSHRNFVLAQPSLVSNDGADNLIFGRGGDPGTNDGHLRVATGIIVDQGIASDGSGFKHARVPILSCPVSGCSVTWTFRKPFADNNYTVTCAPEETDASTPKTGLRFGRIRNRTASDVVFEFDNLSITDLTGIAHCIAIHD